MESMLSTCLIAVEWFLPVLGYSVLLERISRYLITVVFIIR